MMTPQRIDIFCHVIDNFGDVGVCWRLSRQLTNEAHLDVTLWLDNFSSLKPMCAELDLQVDRQIVRGVTLRRWHAEHADFALDDVADVVIEGFACTLPASYIEAMKHRQHPPVWINLEYLSAETWVEGCHMLPSPQSAFLLTKYFFFPGFTERTGGVLRERDLFSRRDSFQEKSERSADFLSRLGVASSPNVCKVSMFCYSSAPLEGLFHAMKADVAPVLCLVPEGVGVAAVSEFLGKPAIAGASATQGALTLHVLPFLDQDDYDQLLWSCDINFVRGEDSFVRAQWAGRPFVWHIYPQSESAHWIKLEAFWERYAALLSPELSNVMHDFWQVWNTHPQTPENFTELWQSFRANNACLRKYCQDWSRQLSKMEDLAGQLLRVIKKIS